MYILKRHGHLKKGVRGGGNRPRIMWHRNPKKVSKILKHRKVLVETKKIELKCCVMSNFLCGSEYQTILSKMKNRLKGTEMSFYK